MTLPDFLTQDDAGSIRFVGHRIDLAHVLDSYNEGYSPETIWAEYPSLSLALVHKGIAFYLDNRDDVDAYLSRFRQFVEERRAQSPRRPTLAHMRARSEVQRTAQGQHRQ
ncbi:MAG: DUF433 domain-containing protein [Gemmataceae bacterium]|nr:DUF433 domain-containing protein [Gemmataceae bacterium]